MSAPSPHRTTMSKVYVFTTRTSDRRNETKKKKFVKIFKNWILNNIEKKNCSSPPFYECISIVIVWVNTTIRRLSCFATGPLAIFLSIAEIVQFYPSPRVPIGLLFIHYVFLPRLQLFQRYFPYSHTVCTRSSRFTRFAVYAQPVGEL